MRVHVVDTGTANLASMRAALARVGADPEFTRDPGDLERARLVVLPGVGAFGAGMARMRECGLADVLTERIRSERPLFAVCLGLQMLCTSSDETEGVAGIGAIPVHVSRFQSAYDGTRITVPQLGWNEVVPRKDATLLERGYAYYANSYHLDRIPEGWSGAESVHGKPFVAALERGPILACQFHPELSGPWGHALLRRWLERGSTC